MRVYLLHGEWNVWEMYVQSPPGAIGITSTFISERLAFEMLSNHEHDRIENKTFSIFKLS